MKTSKIDATSAETASEPVAVPASRVLTPAARRALAEAASRREQSQPELPPEQDGRGGLEPVRYGDWEVKGIASDF